MGKKGGSEAKSSIPGYMQDHSKSALNWGNKLSNAPYQTYGGQRVAGFSPDQNRAMNLTRMQATPGYQFAGRDRVRDSIRDVSADRTSTQTWNDKQRDQYMSPYMDAVADTTASDMERARQVQQSNAGDQAASAGAFGGSRHGVADAESNRNFYDRMGATMGGLRHQGYGQAASIFGQDMGRKLQSDTGNANRSLRADMANQNADMQSYNLWNGIYNNQVNATNRLAGQGDAQQKLRQGIIDTDYNDWAKLNDEPMRRAERFTGLMGSSPDRVQHTQGGPGIGQSLLGAGTTLGAAYLMSDRRVKRDVERIGTDEKTGLGLYAYRYLWSDTPQVGVMADEARRVRPDAVSTGALTGLDMVDYAKLEVAA